MGCIFWAIVLYIALWLLTPELAAEIHNLLGLLVLLGYESIELVGKAAMKS